MPAQAMERNDYLKIPEAHIEVLELAAHGCSSEHIARVVGLSPAAVATIVNSRLSQPALNQLRARAIDSVAAIQEKFMDHAEDAIATVYEVMTKAKDMGTRFKAAQFTLGVVGVSPVHKTETRSYSAQITGNVLDVVQLRLAQATKDDALRSIYTVNPEPVTPAQLMEGVNDVKQPQADPNEPCDLPVSEQDALRILEEYAHDQMELSFPPAQPTLKVVPR